MAITLASGTSYNAGTANLTPTLPSGGEAGDLMICIYGTKPYSDAPTINQNWTDPGSPATDGTVGAGIDVGSMQARFFWKRHTGTETAPTVTNSTNNVSGVAIFLVKPTSGYTLLDPVGSGGGDAGTDTSWSITAASNPEITAGDLLIAFGTFRSDGAAPTSSHSITASGATIATPTVYPATDQSSTSGGDIATTACYAAVTSGTATAAPVFSVTLSAGHSGSGYIIRLREEMVVSDPFPYLGGGYYGG